MCIWSTLDTRKYEATAKKKRERKRNKKEIKKKDRKQKEEEKPSKLKRIPQSVQVFR